MSVDPREYLNDHEEAFRLGLDGRQAAMWTAMPAIVQTINWTQMTLTCVIAIQGRQFNPDGTTTWVTIGNGALQDVPIVFPSAGGFTITFPLKEGDEVLVVFASRCIDAWWQQGAAPVAISQPPLEYRMHDLSDGFAIPGPRSVPRVVASISTTDLQIRNDAGTSYVSIDADGKIKLVSSEIDITGNLKVTGTISATGEITAESATTAIPLSAHVHTGVTTGGSNTGAPIP